jgi:hypothetical protein
MSSKSFWICVVLGLLLFGVVLWSEVLGQWNWLLAALLLVCPVVTGWIAFGERRAERDIAEAAQAAAEAQRAGHEAAREHKA